MTNQEKTPRDATEADLPLEPGDKSVQFDRPVHETGAKINSVTGVNADGSGWTLSVGDRVESDDEPDSEEYDTGRISRFESASVAVVYWDSCCETKIEIERLTSL